MAPKRLEKVKSVAVSDVALPSASFQMAPSPSFLTSRDESANSVLGLYGYSVGQMIGEGTMGPDPPLAPPNILYYLGPNSRRFTPFKTSRYSFGIKTPHRNLPEDIPISDWVIF